MEITRKIPIMNYSVPNPSGESKYVKCALTPYFTNSIRELVKTGGMCVCIHHTISDYRYQILGNKYNELSIVDIIGNISSFDEENMEITINIDDSHFEEGDSRYIDKSKIDNYELFMRSKSSIHHNYDAESGDNLEVHIERLIGFDLVYNENKVMEEESQDDEDVIENE